MSPASLAAQIRSLRAEQLTPDDYMRQLAKLAGLDPNESDVELQDIIDQQRIRVLRRRLAALEVRVSQLQTAR